MKITVCLGDSCHLKGTRRVAETLQKLIAENGLKDEIDLGGTFCLGKCRTGVSVMLDGEYYSLSPETAESFFRDQILPRLKSYRQEA